MQAGTKLIEYHGNATNDIVYSYVRNGRAGNFEVVYRMIDLVTESSERDKGLEDLVKQSLVGNFEDYRNTDDMFARLYAFIKANVKYIPDIAGQVESLKSARRTLSDGYGDCDDHTILNATILAQLGFEPKLVLARQFESQPAFSHIYCVVYVNGKRYVFDTTLPNGKLNDELESFEKQEIPVFNNDSIANNVASLMFRLKHTLLGAGKDAVATLPAITSLLPSGLGFVGANILEQSVNLLLGQDVSQKSPNRIGSEIIAELDQLIAQLQARTIALDHAQLQAKRVVSQLQQFDTDSELFQSIKAAIKPKLEYILNFKEIAAQQGISVIYLNGRAMLCVGAAVIGAGGYWYFKKKRGL